MNESKFDMRRRDFLSRAMKLGATLAAASSSSALLSRPSSKPKDVLYDILIKGGDIFDGASPEPIRGDIGIRGDKIIHIGKLEGKAIKTIDASGLAVTPGFIDVHNHADLSFQKLGFKKYLAYIMPSFKGNYNFLYQGVTTIVAGNCGWGYTETDAWLNLVNSLKFGTNSYHLAPHGVIRQKLFGEGQPEELSQSQLKALKNKVAEAMEQGAAGLSTGLVYAPGFLTRTEEIIEVARVARKYGGIYATHIRNETGKDYGQGKIGAIESVKEAIEIGRRAEIPVQISHLKIMSPINGLPVEKILEVIEKARNEGLDVTADQYPYDSGSSFLTLLLPNEFVEKDGIKKKYKNRQGRGEIQKAIEEVFTYLGPEKILIAMDSENEKHEGKSLQDISEIEGRSPAESFVEMVCQDEVPFGIFFGQEMNVVRQIMLCDYVMTASDGYTVPKGMTKPHPRCYGTFPRKLREFVIEEKIISLAAAIRSMTFLPAEKFKLKGRGRIAEGYFADIAVIDLNKIRDRATYLDPHQYAEGVEYLTVNGVLSIENGKATGERGGRGLRL